MAEINIIIKEADNNCKEDWNKYKYKYKCKEDWQSI